LPLGHPALLVAIVAAAAGVLLTATYPVFETDFWQHLTYGRAIWEAHSVPARHLWSWPTYGAPEVNGTWGFSALIWPVWTWGGPMGLSVWRWLTALAAFGFMWAAARRMGARGLTALVVMVLCSLSYRDRMQVRPETLAGVLLALTVWILESWRHARRDETASSLRDLLPWIIPVAWVWANTHISYFLCFVLLGIHGLDAALEHMASRRRGRAGKTLERSAGPRRRDMRRLALIALAALAVALVNPFGWRALWQPFQYFLVWRHELIYRVIDELQPIPWQANFRNLLPLLMIGWPALALWRARRHGLDRVEALSCLIFTVLALRGARFVGFYALLAAPYLARDLDQWVRARAWPRWTEPPWARAGLAVAGIAAVGAAEWTRPDLPVGIGIDFSRYPIAACDFIERHGLRGRGFNKFEYAGYQLHRFWPDRSRLPFMDIHQSGTREDRDLYARSLAFPEAWRELDAKHRFDYALLNQAPSGVRSGADRTVDFLDADSAWALVLMDDPSRLYVRRSGELAVVAREYGCRALRGGAAATGAAIAAATTDTALREALRDDLVRQSSLSRHNASALSLLALVERMGGRLEESRAHMLDALRIRPRLPRAHEWLGRIALALGRPEEALREFELERRQRNRRVEIDFLTAEAYRMSGDWDRARDYYRRELSRNPGSTAARDSLAMIEAKRSR
jgi:tetratricopeptide (TPR) repeat protein